jgi:lysophospholipase L1-like esterase
MAVVALLATCGGARTPTTPTAPGAPASQPPPGATGCSRTSIGLRPLTDLGSGTYQGQPGGLYPGGSNRRSGGHDAAGRSIARAIEPLDAEGRPGADGRYVFISIGMSNTTQEFSTFKPLGEAEPLKDSRLAIVDGAQGGVTAADWMNEGCPCWATLDQRLRSAGVTPAQVAIAWVKLADRQPASGWPAYAQRLKEETIRVLQIARARYPNLSIAYLSSRIYAGYATTTLNPEPYAYESGFAMKWVVEDQIAGSPALAYDAARGPVQAPWVAWGPYLWADGLTARSDGLAWACTDLQGDGTHPSGSGRQKVAQMLLQFVREDATAREWFLR